MTTLIGQSIGRYHIIEQIGEGGMATVYKAYDTHLDRNVAVKIIRKEIFGPAVLERVIQRFEREGKALAKLSNSHIVHVYDFGEYEGSPYLVMEYVDAGTLKSMIGKPLAWQDAVKILIPVAKALGYAHQRSIIHRDVKPSNILINSEGEPLLTDFGIAKLLEGEDGNTLTGAGVGIGTPEYMAPEQGIGAKDVDSRADIYSLGVVLYELLTGQKPYTAETPMAVVVMQVHDPLPDPRQFVSGLSDAVVNVLFRALAKKVEDRFKNAGELSTALENLLKGTENKEDALAAVSAPQVQVKSNPEETAILPEEILPTNEAVPSQESIGAGSIEPLISSETLETIDDLAEPATPPQSAFDDILNPSSETKETFDDIPSTHSLSDTGTKETIDDLASTATVNAIRPDVANASPQPVGERPNQLPPLPPVPPMPLVPKTTEKKSNLKWVWIAIGVIAFLVVIFVLINTANQPATAPIYDASINNAVPQTNNSESPSSNIGNCSPYSINVGEIFTNQTYTGQTFDQNGDSVSFSAFSGETITLTMGGENGYDTYLELYDPNCVLVASDDDGAGYPNAQITYTTLTSGIFTIIARGFGGVTGVYYLTLEEGSTSNVPASSGNNSTYILQDYYFTVNSAYGWVDSGIYISTGQILSIIYSSGTWSACAAADCGGYVDANGSASIGGGNANSLIYPDNIISGCYHGALIARIGENVPFCVNNYFWENIYTDGELFFSINDAVTSDDDGEITVAISIQ